jgi:hypothetical protein
LTKKASVIGSAVAPVHDQLGDHLIAPQTRRSCSVASLTRWTEVCMAFAALDALREGYDVCLVVDVIGGTSVEATALVSDLPKSAGHKSLFTEDTHFVVCMDGQGLGAYARPRRARR